MIISIIKPTGPTSHDIVSAIRRITHEKRVGHAGTLDPMASGILIIAITRESTKTLNQYVNLDKEYLATIKLDGTSTTEDAEGIITKLDVKHIPTIEEVKESIQQFIGEILQQPSNFSAIKVNGKKAYELARAGKDPKLALRKVIINDIKLESYIWPILTIKVTCHKGVYIRALGRDIGTSLKVGGYLTSLIRTRIGDYNFENSLTLEQFSMQKSTQS